MRCFGCIAAPSSSSLLSSSRRRLFCWTLFRLDNDDSIDGAAVACSSHAAYLCSSNACNCFPPLLCGVIWSCKNRKPQPGKKEVAIWKRRLRLLLLRCCCRVVVVDKLSGDPACCRKNVRAPSEQTVRSDRVQHPVVVNQRHLSGHCHKIRRSPVRSVRHQHNGRRLLWRARRKCMPFAVVSRRRLSRCRIAAFVATGIGALLRRVCTAASACAKRKRVEQTACSDGPARRNSAAVLQHGLSNALRRRQRANPRQQHRNARKERRAVPLRHRIAQVLRPWHRRVLAEHVSEALLLLRVRRCGLGNDVTEVCPCGDASGKAPQPAQRLSAQRNDPPRPNHFCLLAHSHAFSPRFIVVRRCCCCCFRRCHRFNCIVVVVVVLRCVGCRDGGSAVGGQFRAPKPRLFCRRAFRVTRAGCRLFFARFGSRPSITSYAAAAAASSPPPPRGERHLSLVVAWRRRR